MDVTTHTISSPLLRFTSYFAPLFLFLSSNSPNSSHLCNASLTSLFCICPQIIIFITQFVPHFLFFLLPFISLSSPYPCPNSSYASPFLFSSTTTPVQSSYLLPNPSLASQSPPPAWTRIPSCDTLS